MIIGNKTFDTKHHGYIMGILNVTPDSFSDGGKYDHLDAALKHAEEMIKDVELNDMILLFISDRLGRGQKRKDDIEKELSDVKTIIGILKKKYNVDIDVFEKAYNLIIR